MDVNKILSGFIICVLIIMAVVSSGVSAGNIERNGSVGSIYKSELSADKILSDNGGSGLIEIDRKSNMVFQESYALINNDDLRWSDISRTLPPKVSSDITTLFEVSKLIASDGERLDFFGLSVAVDHDVAVVGSPGDDDACEYPLINSGAAYIYRFDGDSWVEEAKLLASDATGYDEFAYSSVAVDGNVVVIGVPFEGWETTQPGAVYIYRFDGDSWVEEAKLVSSNVAECSHFGFSVSVQDDIIVIGAPYDDSFNPRAGAVYIYRFEEDVWVEEAKLTADDGEYLDSFGYSASISDDVVFIGADQDDDCGDESGSAYVFRYNDDLSWSQEAKIVASDGEPDARFGESVSIDGDYAIVGAHRDDDNGAESGSAYIFYRSGSSWSQQQKLTAADAAAGDYFGKSVSIDDDIWREEAKLLASDGAEFDWFGSSVSISKNVALVTAPGDDDNGPRSGSSYLYRYDDGIWREEAKLLASDGAVLDCFGGCASLRDNVALVGSSGDDDSGESSGAAYVFDVSEKKPDIEIVEIKGGLGINAVIKNKGDANATDVTWTINITGGILGLIDKEVTGSIPILRVDEEAKIWSGIFLGTGPIFVTVSASCIEGSSCLETAEGNIFLFITRLYK